MSQNIIKINSSNVSVRIPQVYIIYVRQPEALVYVGQTCQKYGILARFYQHMSGGTLTEKLNEIGIYSFEDITVMAIDLSGYLIFDDVYSRKREALEFLIQREMKVRGCKTKVPFKVVSQVDFNAEVYNRTIVLIAKNIMKSIGKSLPFN